MRARNGWMKSVVFGLLIVCANGTAFAQKTGSKDSVQPVRSAVVIDDATLKTARVLLSGYHAVPTHKALEEAFPGQAREMMLRIASDAGEFDLHRQRAVAALGYWPDAAVYALYSTLLHAPETSEGLKHQLIGHLARVFGDAGVADVSAFLRHEDVQYRLTAVHALGQVDSDVAQKYLKAAVAEEKNDVVLERLERFTMQVR